MSTNEDKKEYERLKKAMIESSKTPAYKKEVYFNRVTAVMVFVYMLLVLIPMSILDNLGVDKEVLFIGSWIVVLGLAMFTAQKITNKKFGDK